MRYVVREYQRSGGYAVIWDSINQIPVGISSCRYTAHAAAERMNDV